MGTSNRKNITSVIGRFGKRLLGFIRQRVNSEADAEDLLQDVWYQLTTTVDTEPIGQVGSWLFKVARNKITDRYRKKRPASLKICSRAKTRTEISVFRISSWTTATIPRPLIYDPFSGRPLTRPCGNYPKSKGRCSYGMKWGIYPLKRSRSSPGRRSIP
jgi:hypothetical protein